MKRNVVCLAQRVNPQATADPSRAGSVVFLRICTFPSPGYNGTRAGRPRPLSCMLGAKRSRLACMKSNGMLDLPGMEENVLLAPHASFRIGGPARFFFRASSGDDAVRAMRAASAARIPCFLLAGGTNVLFSDEGYAGLVVLMENRAWSMEGRRVRAESGAAMRDLVDAAIARGLAGLEWAGGLPGTVGGAVRGNAGAFGGEMKDSVVSVRAADRTGSARSFSREECGFSYRSSVFKERKLIVLEAELELNYGDAESLRGIADSHIAYRKERHPLDHPNAGSIFKNVPYEDIPPSLRKDVTHVVKTDPFPVVPAAFLIAESGGKGEREGNAAVSEKHPNYIINCGGASSHDVRALIGRVKVRVRDAFGVELHEEIEIVE